MFLKKLRKFLGLSKLKRETFVTFEIFCFLVNFKTPSFYRNEVTSSPKSFLEFQKPNFSVQADLFVTMYLAY